VHVLGIAVTGASDISKDLVDSNQMTDYSYIIQPFTLDKHKVILRCASGLGPSGVSLNIVLGGWYFNENKLSERMNCSNSKFEVRGANTKKYPGVINLYLCNPLTTGEEGVYSCVIRNSSMKTQTKRVGLYLRGRSESLDMYTIVNHLSSLYTAAPTIDPASSSTITVAVGSSLTLSCTSQGSPPDTFTWRKDNGPMIQSTSITNVTHNNSNAVFRANYFINSTTASDNGTFTCTVTNPIGSDDKNITVIVVGKYIQHSI